MDPISAAASIITILSTVVALSGGLLSLVGSISNTPEDLRALLNELQDLRVVLASIELSIKSADGFQENEQLLNILPTLLRRMEDKLKKLERHIRGFGENNIQGKMINFKGLEWTLWGKDKARRIRDDISSLKWPITTYLGSLSM